MLEWNTILILSTTLIYILLLHNPNHILHTTLTLFITVTNRTITETQTWAYPLTMTNITLTMSTTVTYYIMAGRAFVVAKEAFIMETVVFCHCDHC